MFTLSIETPKPIHILKNGPAKHPTIAIWAIPHFAIPQLVTISPTVLPNVRRVIPKYDDSISKTIPIKPIMSTSIPLNNLIQITLRTKVIRENTMLHYGGFSLSVKM